MVAFRLQQKGGWSLVTYRNAVLQMKAYDFRGFAYSVAEASPSVAAFMTRRSPWT
jgi:hypothetical protein